MSAADCITEAAVPAVERECAAGLDQNGVAERAEADPGAQMRKRLYISFVGTMFLGFGLAGWYLQARIVSADAATGPAPVSAAMPAPTAPLPAAAPVALKVPERFLEVTSLGTNQDIKFMRRLKSEGFEARLSVNEDARPRILIGPFPDADVLARAEQKLSRSGVLALEITN